MPIVRPGTHGPTLCVQEETQERLHGAEPARSLKIAEQLEETWLRPADWETYHSKVQEIVVDVEPANIDDLLN